MNPLKLLPLLLLTAGAQTNTNWPQSQNVTNVFLIQETNFVIFFPGDAGYTNALMKHLFPPDGIVPMFDGSPMTVREAEAFRAGASHGAWVVGTNVNAILDGKHSAFESFYSEAVVDAAFKNFTNEMARFK